MKPTTRKSITPSNPTTAPKPKSQNKPTPKLKDQPAVLPKGLKTPAPKLPSGARMASSPRNPRQTTSRKPTQAGTSKFSPLAKMPTGDYSENGIHKRLKKKSPWYESIQHPKQGAGCKIPDSIGTDTGTLQMILPLTLSANSAGIAGVKVVCPYPNNVANASSVGRNYMTTLAASTSSNVQWGDGTTVNGAYSFPSNEFLVENAQGVRVVSADITAYHEISSNNDSGEFCCWSVPFNYTGSSGQTYASYTQYMNSITAPLNQKRAVTTRWYPYNLAKQVTDATPNVLETLSYVDFIVPNVTLGQTLPEWEFGIVTLGIQNNGVVRFEITINYEFLPTLLALDILTPEASPSDVVEENLVKSWLPDLPKALSLPPSRIMAPAADSVREENFGLGMLYDVIKEAGPLLLGLL